MPSQVNRKMNAMQIKRAILLIGLVALAGINQASAGCFDKRAPGMDWSGCMAKDHKMLDNSNFTGSRFDNANLSMSSLDESNFEGASLVKTDLTRVSAKRTRFVNADLSKAVGYRAVFDRAKFKDTDVTKSEFSRASFRGAELSGVDFSKSELGRVDFTSARLQGVNFEYSNISRVQFAGAKLDSVNFKGAYTFLTRFEDVDLLGTLNLDQLHLELACGNAATRLPEGLTMPETWPCSE
jgi:uncharacterized protein YjbI with pentapeptide repeats